MINEIIQNQRKYKQGVMHASIIKEQPPTYYRVQTEGAIVKGIKQKKAERNKKKQMIDIQQIAMHNETKIKIKKISIKEYIPIPKPITEQRTKKVYMMKAHTSNQNQPQEKCYTTKVNLAASIKSTATNDKEIIANNWNSNKIILLPRIKQDKQKVNILKINNNINITKINLKIPLNNFNIQKKKPYNDHKGFGIPNNQRIFLLKKQKTHAVTEPNYHIEYSYKENQNESIRKTMEDLYFINTNITQRKREPVAFFAIYDGHNGINPAEYCQKNLHKILVNQLHETQFKIDVSLEKTFVLIDEQLKTVPKSDNSGTTATVVVLYKKMLFCANVGDSSCYVIQEDMCIKMTQDHNCLDPIEVNRITQREGVVYNKRVFGSLEITRALGDLEMKKYGVIPNPTIIRHDISNKDKFAVIASDGVWTALSENEILKHVIKNKDITASALSEWIVSSSMDNYSKDNISCIVIKF